MRSSSLSKQIYNRRGIKNTLFNYFKQIPSSKYEFKPGEENNQASKEREAFFTTHTDVANQNKPQEKGIEFDTELKRNNPFRELSESSTPNSFIQNQTPLPPAAMLPLKNFKRTKAFSPNPKFKALSKSVRSKNKPDFFYNKQKRLVFVFLFFLGFM